MDDVAALRYRERAEHAAVDIRFDAGQEVRTRVTLLTPGPCPDLECRWAPATARVAALSIALRDLRERPSRGTTYSATLRASDGRSVTLAWDPDGEREELAGLRQAVHVLGRADLVLAMAACRRATVLTRDPAEWSAGGPAAGALHRALSALGPQSLAAPPTATTVNGDGESLLAAVARIVADGIDRVLDQEGLAGYAAGWRV
jgi:hypothetical protein